MQRKTSDEETDRHEIGLGYHLSAGGQVSDQDTALQFVARVNQPLGNGATQLGGQLVINSNPEEGSLLPDWSLDGTVFRTLDGSSPVEEGEINRSANSFATRHHGGLLHFLRDQSGSAK